jgi:hypothetical protein
MFRSPGRIENLGDGLQARLGTAVVRARKGEHNVGLFSDRTRQHWV